MLTTRKKVGTAALAVTAMAATLLTGCSSNNNASQSASPSASQTASNTSAAKGATSVIKTVASTTQICDYITELASDSSPDSKLTLKKTGADGKKETLGAKDGSATIDLTCLLEPNATAHEHEMTPEQTEALQNADLFFVSGVDLEHFLDDAVSSSGFKGKMVVTSGVLGAVDVDDLNAQQAKEKDLPYTVDRGIAKVELAKWPFPAEEGETEPEFRFDPHVWTSPKNASVQVKNIGNALETALPAQKNLLKDHVDSFAKQLDELDKWVASSVDTVKKEDRVLFTSHDAFGYFSKAYGIDFKGAALSDFNNQQDATADKVNETVKAVKDAHAIAIFAENSNNPKSVETVAKEAGVKAIIGDDALYGDSLGPAGSDGETYIGSILHNVTNLVKAWNGTPATIPSDIQKYAPKDIVD